MAIATSGAYGKLAGLPGGADGIEDFVEPEWPLPKPPSVPDAGTQAQAVEEPSRGRAPLGLGVAVKPIETEVSAATPAVAICQVLAAWRAAERELASLGVDSPDRGRVQALIVDHQATYLRLFDERMGWGDVNGGRHDGFRLPGG